MRTQSLAPLPIDAVLADIPRALAGARACVVQAPPGAGKTTRVPLVVREHARRLGIAGQIVVLEPRRVAARAAAQALARNLGEKAGGTVGYKVRFEEVSSQDTEIMVVTEGILGRRFLSDPTLDGVGCVILDEIHERSIHTDLALAFLRELLEVRDDLKVIAMSATLDAGAVSRFLFDAPIVTSEGRPFPVVITHVPPEADARLEERVSAAVRKLMIAPDDDGGDVLVFLPGAGEIRRAEERLRERPLPARGGDAVEIVPLHGSLSFAEQDRALTRTNQRRVILATNVAETSLTIDGVSSVVDTGLVKIARHDPATDREHLDTVRISLASAEQRAGRAGRQRPGRCLRLWSTSEHNTLRENHAPEILRADLARPLLDVLTFHPGDPRAFAFFEAPPTASIERALDVLRALGAVTRADDAKGVRLTKRGEVLARLPLHPRTGTLLLEAGYELEEVALEAAILDDERTHPREEARTATDSDLAVITQRLDRRNARELFRAQEELVRHARSARVDDTGSRMRALVSAYLDRLCVRRRKGESDARMVGGRGVKLAKESGVKDAPLFLALSLGGTHAFTPGTPRASAGAGGAALVNIAEAVTLEQIRAHRPDAITTQDEAVFDAERGTLVGVRRTRVLDLVVDERTGVALPEGARGSAVAQAIAGDLALLKLNDDVQQLRARLSFARAHLSEHAWPDASDDGIRALLPDVCASVRSVDEANRADWKGAFFNQLDFKTRKLLDDEVPERIEVPSGSHIAVDYVPAIAEGGAPVLAVRLQELFGLADTPRVARNRVPVVLHLLSPGYKPVQVTKDLRSFWTNTYAEVRKEMRSRYPKHSWPDDPWTATPTARAKRRGT